MPALRELKGVLHGLFKAVRSAYFCTQAKQLSELDLLGMMLVCAQASRTVIRTGTLQSLKHPCCRVPDLPQTCRCRLIRLLSCSRLVSNMPVQIDSAQRY